MKKIVVLFLVLSSFILTSCEITKDYYIPNGEIYANKIGNDKLSFDNIYLYNLADTNYLSKINYRKITKLTYLKYSYDESLRNEYFNQYQAVIDRLHEIEPEIADLVNIYHLPETDPAFDEYFNLFNELDKYERLLKKLLNYNEEISKEEFYEALDRAGEEYCAYTTGIVSKSRYDFYVGQKIVNLLDEYLYFDGQESVQPHIVWNGRTNYKTSFQIMYPVTNETYCFHGNYFKGINYNSNGEDHEIFINNCLCVPICKTFLRPEGIGDPEGLYVEHIDGQIVSYKIKIETECYERPSIQMYCDEKQSDGIIIKEKFYASSLKKLRVEDAVYFEETSNYNTKIIGDSLVYKDGKYYAVRRGYCKLIITDNYDKQIGIYNFLIE